MRGFCCAIHSFAGAVVGLDFGAFTGDKRAVQECSGDAGFLGGCFGCAEFSEGGIEFRGVHGVFASSARIIQRSTDLSSRFSDDSRKDGSIPENGRLTLKPVTKLRHNYHTKLVRTKID